jgi:hypothetical protein
MEQKLFRIIVLLTFVMRKTYSVFFPSLSTIIYNNRDEIVLTTTTTTSINCVLRIQLLYLL